MVCMEVDQPGVPGRHPNALTTRLLQLAWQVRRNPIIVIDRDDPASSPEPLNELCIRLREMRCIGRTVMEHHLSTARVPAVALAGLLHVHAACSRSI